MESQDGLRCIATEEHFTIPELGDRLSALSKSTWRNPDLRLYGRTGDLPHPIIRKLLDIEDRLEQMDRNSVDMQVLSVAVPGVQLFAPDLASKLASIVNERLANIVGAHPTRFAGLAAFAPHDPSGAVKEMSRAISELNLNGFVVNSHTDGEYLDDDKFWSIFETAEALNRPIYLHPRALPETAIAPFVPYELSKAAWGYAVETGTHALRIMLSGALDRFPNLTIVLGHMGEGLPYWLYRLDKWTSPPKGFLSAKSSNNKQAELKPSEYLERNFVITTSGMHDRPPLELCRTVLGTSSIMFATDYPFEGMDGAREFYANLDWPRDELANVLSRNAKRIFGI